MGCCLVIQSHQQTEILEICCWQSWDYQRYVLRIRMGVEACWHKHTCFRIILLLTSLFSNYNSSLHVLNFIQHIIAPSFFFPLPVFTMGYERLQILSVCTPCRSIYLFCIAWITYQMGTYSRGSIFCNSNLPKKQNNKLVDLKRYMHFAKKRKKKKEYPHIRWSNVQTWKLQLATFYSFALYSSCLFLVVDKVQ